MLPSNYIFIVFKEQILNKESNHIYKSIRHKTYVIDTVSVCIISKLLN